MTASRATASWTRRTMSASASFATGRLDLRTNLVCPVTIHQPLFESGLTLVRTRTQYWGDNGKQRCNTCSNRLNTIGVDSDMPCAVLGCDLFVSLRLLRVYWLSPSMLTPLLLAGHADGAFGQEQTARVQQVRGEEHEPAGCR